MSLEENFELRIKLGSASSLTDFAKVASELKERYSPYHEGKILWTATTESDSCNLILPPWLCQSYIRIPPEEHLKKVEEKNKQIEEGNGPVS